MDQQRTIISHQQYMIFPGIEYDKEVFIDAEDGRQCAYVLRISKNADIRMDTVMDPNGQFKLQEPSVSAEACCKENETLLGVVNADFFNMTNGVPQGIVVMNGKIIKDEMPDTTRFFGILRDGTPVIGDKRTFLNCKQDLKMAVGGRDFLVDGDSIPEPVLELRQNRHPRTAIGICENNDLLIVVLDGRNPGVSEGLYLKRFGLYLQSLGAIKALNLDGGGSSVMALRMLGREGISIINTPSDGFERVCADGIALFAQHKGDGVCHSAYITPQQECIAPGTDLALSVYGLDSLLGPCPLPRDIQFSVPEDSGCIVLSNGSFRSAQTDCDVTVSVSSGKRLLGTALLHVRTPDTLHAPASWICPEDSVDFLPVTASLKGRTVYTNSTSYIFHPSDDIGHFSNSGFFYSKAEACEGDVLVSAKNNGPSIAVHVRVGSLPSVYTIEPDLVQTTGCTICSDHPLSFSSRHGDQVALVSILEPKAELTFSAAIHKKPKAVGVWVHPVDGELSEFSMTIQAGPEVLPPAVFKQGGPSDSVWTYMEAPVSDYTGQTKSLIIRLSVPNAQGTRFAIDSFRIVYDYVEDDIQIPEVKHVQILKYPENTEEDSFVRIKITAFLGIGDLPPWAAPIDYTRARILIDNIEYTGSPGYYGVNKGAAAVMLHSFPIAKGVHSLSICAQTYNGFQTWKNITFDTEQLETKPLPFAPHR